ncbi:Tho complex subunit 7-domain-containing protein [Lineolata rhizophorae]|uniref:Tho complex subunit 7-domain-containing protein n=1 Tax=Lineolata rhizophorae TaxID=578093 RepID=A0A6A6P0Z3_9PEZI|nr:Tho complex subunit 7-domain-containing protein [Lineolata rhizophorae]
MANPSDYGLLDVHEEEALVKARLLAIEEKSFKRITQRLLSPDSLVYKPPTQLPTPPPDGTAVDEAIAATAAARGQQAKQRALWRQELALDFAALEASMVRIQLLRDSNARERERYAAEKGRILATAQRVRDSTAELRGQLDGARTMLALRKEYDALAERITSNRMLRPREDQRAQLAKLDAEIAELEHESRVYAATWAERRNQFGRIVDEGRQLLRLIRDEKEEAERKEGMEGGEDVDDGEGSTTRGEPSVVGTPRPDGSATPMHVPQEESQGAARLGVGQKGRLLPSSTPARGTSREQSPASSKRDDGELPDTYMAEAQEEGEEIEEGEEEEDGLADKMDEA